MTSEDEDDGTLRHFVVKREYAEGSIMMSMGKFPAAALPEPGQPAPMMYRYLLRDLSDCARTGCSKRGQRHLATAFRTTLSFRVSTGNAHNLQPRAELLA